MKGLLSFLFLLTFWSINSQKNIELINEFLFKSSNDLHLAPSDYQPILVTDESYSKLSETHHVYVNQTFNGIEILKSGGNFAIKNNEIVLVGDTIHDSEVAEEMGVDCILVDHGHVNTQRLIKTGRIVQSSIRSVLELIN